MGANIHPILLSPNKYHGKNTNITFKRSIKIISIGELFKRFKKAVQRERLYF